MATEPKTVDEYLARVSTDQRVALQRLRGIIRRTAPRAEECISYRIPTFRLHGALVGFGATPKHCAFYLLSSSTVAEHRRELANYGTSTGTIRFQPDQPLPAALVRKLVKARMKENERGRIRGLKD